MAVTDIKVLYNKLDEIVYEELDITEILGDREYPNFRQNWVRVFMDLMRIKYETNYPAGREQIRDTYRKRSFEKIMQYSNSMGLAMAVSEDMEILYDGLTLKYEDPWFLELVESYAQGKIPVGTLD